jgi:hypothetical protein
MMQEKLRGDAKARELVKMEEKYKNCKEDVR